MATDVAPEMLEQIQSIFENKFNRNRKTNEVYAKLQNGEKLTYAETNEFAQEVGIILASAFKRVFSPESLPDGKMYYNIADRVVRPMLNNNYDLIAAVAEQTQNSLNKAAGIGLQAKRPKRNTDRIQGIIDKVSSYDDYTKAAWVLDEPIVNYSQSIVDEFIKENAEFQYDVGFKPRISRFLAGSCCEWCSRLAGDYEYPKVPEDFYRRHERCRCTIIYEPTKGNFQGAHTKRKYADIHSAEIEERVSNLQRDLKKRKNS